MLSDNFKQEIKILWPFYLTTFIIVLSGVIIAPVIILYFQGIGLSFTQISLLFALPLIGTFLFEIPTGAVADLYGRKFSCLLGMLLTAILYLFVPYFKSITVLIFLFFMMAVVGTLSSGADTAWVVDLLKYKKKSNLLQSYYAKMMFISGFALALGGILSSFILRYLEMKYLWFIISFGIFLSFLIVIFFTEEHFVRKKVKVMSSFTATFKKSKEGFNYVIKHPVLFYLLLDMILWSFAAIFTIAWQPYFNGLGLDFKNFGFLFSVTGVIAMIAPLGSKYITKIFKKEKPILIINELVSGFLFFMLANVTSLTFAIVIYIAITPLEVITQPVYERFKQQFIPSSKRATINSLFSAVKVPGRILSYIVGGVLLDKFGIKITIMVIALFSIGSVIFFLLMKPEGQKKHV